MSDINIKKRLQYDQYKLLTGDKKRDFVDIAVKRLFRQVEDKNTRINYVSIEEINLRVLEAFGLKFSRKFLRASLEKMGSKRGNIEGKVIYVGIEMRPELIGQDGTAKTIVILSDSGIIQEDDLD